MEKIFKNYLRRLTNLTGNNRSLLLLRLVADQFIDVHKFNRLKNLPSFSVIEAVINKKQFQLCDEVDPRDSDSNQVSNQLKKLKRRESYIFEEKGTRDLYIGWPFVRGQLNDGTPVRCPLLFFPVKIELLKGKWILFPDQSIDISFNKTFLLAYSHFNNINLDEDFLEKDFEDYDTDTTVFRTALYQDLKESVLEINFNRDNFSDQLEAFETFTKADFIEKTAPGELKLFPEAVLGIFPQGGSNLTPDYEWLLENDEVNSLEELFIKRHHGRPNPTLNFIQQVSEENTYAPFELDAFQENALKGVKAGNSLVVQGPPGTGKSQLICNLISDAVANNKTVLVVCQKKVALDVVYNRLLEMDLADFTALVHDHKNDRKDVFRKISDQIDKLDEYELDNRSLDAIQLERNFLKNTRLIDQLTSDLEEFRSALFDEKECGLSIKELYLTSSPDEKGINLKNEYRNFNFHDVDEFIKRLNRYAHYNTLFNDPGYPLLRRRSFAGFTVGDMQMMSASVDDIKEFRKAFDINIEKVTGSSLDYKDAQALLRRRHFVVEMLGILEKPEAYEWFQHMMNFPDSQTDPLWLSNVERVMIDCYKGQEPEITLTTGELGQFQEILQQKLDTRRSLLKYVKWHLLERSSVQRIDEILIRNKLSNDKRSIDVLVEKIDNRLNLEHNLTKLRSKRWIKTLPSDYSKVQIQTWFHLLKQTIKAKLTFNGMRNFKEFFNVSNLSYEKLNEKLSDLYKEIDKLAAKEKQWSKYLSDTEIQQFFNETEKIDPYLKSLKKDFDSLHEYDALAESLLSHELEIIKKLNEEELLKPESADKVFLNSLKLAWIEHIEIKYPILRSVSSLKLKEMENELQQAIRQKMEMSKDILLLKAKERTYENVEYNRLNNRTTYRELHHQVTKKRRLWPLRKLITEYSEELFNILPCWMSSPEAVSALFPMQQLFDLIIFDEASQCFVEKGIPAIYRGKQVVIAGDHQQLRPNDIYQIRWNQDEDESPELEVESLLELGSRYLPSVQLKGHYRSESLQLIEFSNHHFYDRQLRLLPQKDRVNTLDPAINYLKVDGTWEKNRNTAEAEKVAELVLENVSKGDLSIGVVTFNAQQQDHIADLLERKAAENSVILPSSIFVKNIENVQGDEKDLIIFSVGYAPDKNGKISMQFGTLNQINGENRLNVAITRARKKIIIVSSILPNQLRTDEAKNEGPKLLKSYLEYAIEVSKGEFTPAPFFQGKHHDAWYLKNQLKVWAKSQKDIEMIDELPFAELTVKKDNKYAGLLLTDDNLYFQSMTVKDYHAYTPFALYKKGWPFRMVFSREYWQQREEVEHRLKQFLAHHVEV